MGFYRHKVACSSSGDETSSPPRQKQRNVKFYLPSVNMSLHIFTADIVIDTFATDL